MYSFKISAESLGCIKHKEAKYILLLAEYLNIDILFNIFIHIDIRYFCVYTDIQCLLLLPLLHYKILISANLFVTPTYK